MKRKFKKLSLNTETLGSLHQSSLKNVEGGNSEGTGCLTVCLQCTVTGVCSMCTVACSACAC